MRNRIAIIRFRIWSTAQTANRCPSCIENAFYRLFEKHVIFYKIAGNRIYRDRERRTQILVAPDTVFGVVYRKDEKIFSVGFI